MEYIYIIVGISCIFNVYLYILVWNFVIFWLFVYFYEIWCFVILVILDYFKVVIYVWKKLIFKCLEFLILVVVRMIEIFGWLKWFVIYILI